MHRFRIEAIADPQSLPRIAGAFAQRAIVPASLSARFVDGALQVEATVPGLDDRQAAIVAAKLGEAVVVIAVELEVLEEVFA